jgi:hypothetical protein
MFPVNTSLVNRSRFLPGLGVDMNDCSTADAGPCRGKTGAECGQCMTTLIAAAQSADRSQTYTGMSAEERAQAMQKSIMKSAITGAGTQVGIQVVLSVIPVVGQALAAVAGAISFFGGQRYEKKTKDMVEEKKRDLEAYVAGKQQTLNAAVDGAYKAAWSQALTLAKSPYPIVFDQHTEQQVFMRRPMNGLGIIDKLTGRDTFTKARSQMDALVREQKQKLDIELDPIITRANSTDFRNVLAKSIAVNLRQLPEYKGFAKYFDRTGPQSYTANVADPTSPAYTPGAIVDPSKISVDTSLWKKLTIGGAAITGGIFLMRM